MGGGPCREGQSRAMSSWLVTVEVRMDGPVGVGQSAAGLTVMAEVVGVDRDSA